MLNKLLLLLLTFLSTRALQSNGPNPMAQFANKTLQRLAIGVAVGGIGIATFAGGLFLILADLYDVYSQYEILALSRLSAVGFILIALPVFGLAAWSWMVTLRERSEKSKMESESILTPIIAALSEIIHEYTAHQKVKRYNDHDEEQASRQAATAAKAHTEPPHSHYNGYQQTPI
ncbi:MAG: hypothetical protein AB7N80_04025 [Bdellovibrionales bacterium]